MSQEAIKRECKVYCLSSTEDGRVRYIGQTVQTLSRRLAQHLADVKRKQASHIRCYRWIRKTLQDGFEIQIHLIENDCLIDVDEQKWISFYREQFDDLTNTLDGGQRGRLGMKCSEETRQRMRQPRSMETRLKMMKPRSEETKRKMSLAQIGNTKGRGEANANSKLTDITVAEIRSKRALGVSCSELALEYGIRKSSVSKAALGQSWKHVEYPVVSLCEHIGRNSSRSNRNPT